MIATLLFLTAIAAPPRFTEVAAETGLDFRHWNGMAGNLYISEIFGPGVAFFDGDGDGDLDLLAIEGALLDPAKDVPLQQPPPDRRARYFRNQLMEEGKLRFADATENSGLRIDGYAMGIATGDIDNDGDVDIYVSHLGRGRLFRNSGGGRFEDVSAAAGIQEAEELERAEKLWGTSASFFDAEGDGDLDLFVAHYLAYGPRRHRTCVDRSSAPDYCGPESFEPIQDRYFRNQGDGTFEEATLEAGFGRNGHGKTDGPGLGTVITDFDGDGLVDLYVANDGTENQLWRSRSDGTFEDAAPLAGAAVDGNGQPEASMGVDSGDVDGDGREDLIAVHFDPETKTLYRNTGEGYYEDATFAAGLAQKGFTSFGAGFFDYDLDGDLDLFVVNGAIHLVPDQVAAGSKLPLAQRKQFFENTGTGRFREILPPEEKLVGLEEVSRGLAFGDVDNDGDVDLLIGNNGGPLRLLRNEAKRQGRWLGLGLSTGKRDAQGARVIIEAGGRTLVRRTQTDGSYLSARDPRLQIGLSANISSVKVKVEWPDRVAGLPKAEIFQITELDRYHRLQRGQGKSAESDGSPASGMTFGQECPDGCGSKPPHLEGGSARGAVPALTEPQEEGSPRGEAPRSLGSIGSPPSPSAERGAGGRGPNPVQEGEIPWTASLALLEPRVRDQLKAAYDKAEAAASESAAQAWLGLAELSHAYRLPQTPSFYRQAQKHDPGSFRALYLAAVFALDKNQPAEAEAALEQAAKLAPSETLVAFRQAQAAFARGDFEGARTRAEKIEKPGAAAAAKALAAEAAVHQNDLEAAVRLYAQALELAPEATRLNAAAAAVHLRLGDKAKAETLLAKRGDGLPPLDDPYLREIETRIESAQRFQEIGEEALRAGRKDDAIAAFRRAAELAPADRRARANLGAALAAAGHATEAHAIFEKLLEEDPRHPGALLQLAIAAAAGGEDAKAENLYRRLLEVEPQSSKARINLANLLRRRFDHSGAAELYRQAARLEPADPALRLALIRTLVATGGDHAALGAAEEAHRDLPREPLLQNALARLLAGSREPADRNGERALALAQRAFAESPILPVVETLAMAHAQLGNFQEAQAWQQKAIAAARGAGRLEDHRHLEENAARYARGLAAQAPWP
jgi:enediyne biosynthesis protein E4